MNNDRLAKSEMQVSNDQAMWSEYHARPGAIVNFLHLVKATIVCRMFANRIMKMTGPVSSVLELGCGTASTLEQIRRQTGASCVGVDRCDEALEIARKKYPALTLKQGDIFNLPFELHSFDLVYSVGLFEHFDLDNQNRLLEIHGKFARKSVVMMVPADSIVFNSIIKINKGLLGRQGTWADEQVFSAPILRGRFPGYQFTAAKDKRFLNMILWFGWNINSDAALG